MWDPSLLADEGLEEPVCDVSVKNKAWHKSNSCHILFWKIWPQMQQKTIYKPAFKTSSKWLTRNVCLNLIAVKISQAFICIYIHILKPRLIFHINGQSGAWIPKIIVLSNWPSCKITAGHNDRRYVDVSALLLLIKPTHYPLQAFSSLFLYWTQPLCYLVNTNYLHQSPRLVGNRLHVTEDKLLQLQFHCDSAISGSTILYMK